jgi:hypothetical protein
MGKNFIIASALLLITSVLIAQGKLVVSPYPGSEAIRTPQGDLSYKTHAINSWQEGFLSKDDASKIVAHYKPKAQKEIPQTDGSRMLVMDEWPSGGEMGPYQACVHVFARRSGQAKDLPVFERLLDNVHTGQHTQAEYDNVYAKYRHLNGAFFKLSTTKSKSGSVQDVQEALYAEYYGKLKADQDALNATGKDQGKKIQELIQQGKMAEAGELMKQVSGAATSASKKDYWPMWLEFLEKAQKESYPSFIIIDQGRSR